VRDMHERRQVYTIRELLERSEPTEKTSKFLAEMQKVTEEIGKDVTRAIRNVTAGFTRRNQKKGLRRRK